MIDLRPNTLVRWKLNDNDAEADVEDSSGNGIDTTAFETGSTPLATEELYAADGVGGGSFKFIADGHNRLDATIAYYDEYWSKWHAAFYTNGNWTIALWFKIMSDLTGTNPTLLYLADTAGEHLRGISFVVSSLGKVGIGGTASILSDDSYNDGKWHLILASRNDTDGKIYLYVDTALIGSATLGKFEDPENPNEASNDFMIAFGDGVYIDYFNDQIDNIMVFNKVLSETERAFLYNGGLGTETLYNVPVKFGDIADVHFNEASITDKIVAGGGGFRRFSTASARLIEAAGVFETADLDFCLTHGDNLDGGTKTNLQSMNLLASFREKTQLVTTAPHYNLQGHHEAINFQPTYAGYSGSLTWDDYFGEVDINHGARENAYPYDDCPLSYTFEKQGVRFVVYARWFGQGDWVNTKYSGEYGLHSDWLASVLDVDMPCVILSHVSLTGLSGTSQFQINDAAAIQAILEAKKNVQAVFSAHWHHSDYSWDKTINGIPYIHLRGSVHTRMTLAEYQTISGDKTYDRISEDAVTDNAFYIIELDPEQIWTPYGLKPKIKITGYGLGSDKTRDWPKFLVA